MSTQKSLESRIETISFRHWLLIPMISVQCFMKMKIHPMCIQRYRVTRNADGHRTAEQRTIKHNASGHNCYGGMERVEAVVTCT